MLTIVPTSLGNDDDNTLRAIETLKNSDLVIVEQFREGSTILKKIGIQKTMMELNEHSKPEDILELVKLCHEKSVALISDCGTPNFCDPGADLIRECRKNNTLVKALPGASSLSLILSLSSVRITRFLFVGFLPAKNELRKKEIQSLGKEKGAMIFMDTPYRLGKLVTELAAIMPNRKALLGLNLTIPNEIVTEDTLKKLSDVYANENAEFMLLVYPS